jgi:hypothetical protein
MKSRIGRTHLLVIDKKLIHTPEFYPVEAVAARKRAAFFTCHELKFAPAFALMLCGQRK